MDLWIRSQDKTKISKISNVQYYYKSNLYGVRGEGGNHYVGTYYDNLDILGEYRTKERALEVLDEIQRTITKVLVNKNNDLTGKYSLEVIDTAIYEMPES